MESKMKLSYEGLKDRAAWEAAGVILPDYDAAALAERTKKDPMWVHFGIGNIFRIFIGGIADTLIRKGLMNRGITCAETFDYEVADKIYDPFDNLVMAVTLHEDGKVDKRVLGPLTEAVRANSSDEAGWSRLKAIFTNPGLQLVSFTITEKGYALRSPDGQYLGYVSADIEKGPSQAVGAMGIVTAMLYERYKNGKAPLALLSMDNVSQNGKKLRESVLEMAEAWKEKGYVEAGFIDYLKDEACITFPWSMIDKITPRPSESVCKMLEESGIENMQPVVTSKHTYIAPYANAEEPQYLVVEDAFPNGRPPLEEAGVYMTDRETVNKAERMKVTVCLNPIHTALCTYDCLLGYELFADGMKDPEIAELARQVGYVEGLPVVEDPGILSPEAFLDELMRVRFPNPYLGDTSARIATDISQMTAIRFGETVKAYVARDGDAKKLVAIPLAVAGWIRYLLAVDDEGKPMELSPDPMIPYMKEQLSGIEFNHPESLTGQLKGVLSNETLFGTDLYKAGIGELIEEMVRSEIAGPGAVRKTLKEYLWK
jgi:fructuronate reductase